MPDQGDGEAPPHGGDGHVTLGPDRGSRGVGERWEGKAPGGSWRKPKPRGKALREG